LSEAGATHAVVSSSENEGGLLDEAGVHERDGEEEAEVVDVSIVLDRGLFVSESESISRISTEDSLVSGMAKNMVTLD
jgi:hypothetical protein